ncbi:hypothetical protein EDB80DRAFT_592232 [Ilyonectria destructans]|nr:hypothetical protein EDB80DRAFT_592232 [Ilyonectria destructans]
MTVGDLMPQACERCWKRKQKCDRRKPSCLQCRASSSPCIERRLGTALDPADPQSHHSYIESLKRRVEMLKTRLEASSSAASDCPTVRSHFNLEEDRSATPRQYPNTRETQLGDSEVAQASESGDIPHGDTLQTEMGYLSLSAMDELTWEQPFSSRNISFYTLVQAVTCVSGSNPSVSDSQNAAIFGPLGDFHRGLFRQGVSLTTVETEAPFQKFVDLVKYVLPFTPVEQLILDYHDLLQAHEDKNVSELVLSNPGKIILIHLAVATGVLLSKDHRFMESYATALALTAYQLAPRAIAQSDDLGSAQCLTMMAIFSMYSAFGGSTWHLLGLATTRCISGGMHNARVSDPESDDVKRRNNSRTFWTLYVLDVLVSISLDRPFQLHDEDITTTAPSITNTRDYSEEVHSWNVQHAMLLHDVRQNPSKGVLFHFSNYRYWRETAPINKSNQCHTWLEKYHFRRLCCRVVLAVLQISDSSQPEKLMPMIVDNAEQEFTGFIATLEDQINAEGCAFTTFDGIDVFCAGVAWLYLLVRRHQIPLALKTVQTISKSGQRVLRILAVISERHRCAQSLYGVLNTFSETVQGEGDWPKVESLVLASEMTIPQGVQKLMRSTINLIHEVPDSVYLAPEPL